MIETRTYGVMDRVYGVMDRVYVVMDRVYGVMYRVYGVMDRVYGVMYRVYGIMDIRTCMYYRTTQYTRPDRIRIIRLKYSISNIKSRKQSLCSNIQLT